ncbi:MAG: FliO/MopB family protein [Halobacteriovoraceae bacterium]|jgi:flagellar biogenesis protein FliO|nr:FliO/MopB family protein [Halobacteriovoraceae bacterium]
MKRNKLFILLIISIFLSSAMASVEIKKVDFKTLSKTGIVSIHYTGKLKNYPELKIVGKTIQVNFPDSKIKKSIEKSVSFSSKLIDTKIRAYQTSKNVAKIKALLPFLIEKKKDQVTLSIKDNKVELTFPRIKVNLKKAPKYGTILKQKKVKKEFLDEAYLNSLLKIKDKKTTTKKKPTNLTAKVDSVKNSQSSVFKNNKGAGNSFSVLEYGGKFVAFLGFVLLLFYGVVTLMKKGFIKKGKLGFLNNADQISIINQTYIAPKKSLMLIKAHNQVFLVSNTDQGIHPISEIKDAAGLLKDGEKSINGHNFDSNLTEAVVDKTNDQKIQIKEDITKSNQQSSLSSYLNVKDKVKFSDQIKKKVKNLKPLH